MSNRVTRKVEFHKRLPSGGVESCTLEQFDDGDIYVVGNELGELIVEFADDAYEKAVSQLADLGYREAAKTDAERGIK